MTFVKLAVEGETDVPVAERMLRCVGLDALHPIVTHGKTKLDRLIPGLNRAAKGMNWLILRDLDHDAPCASALVRTLLAGQISEPRFSLRVAIRATESWLLADGEAFGDAFFIPGKRIPDNPDELGDPKQALVNACRHSSRREVRRAMTPRPGSGRRVGPEFRSRVVHFAETRWRPRQAATRSPSLERTLATFQRLRSEGAWT